jgi:DNA-binding MarR family transcriptional regulator
MPRPTDSRAASDGVSITLMDSQVNEIVRKASASSGIALSLAGLRELPVFDLAHEQLNNQRLSRSLMIGLIAYASFPSDGTYLGVIELARVLHANSSTVHRYLQTLVVVGLLERDPATRRYRRAQ